MRIYFHNYEDMGKVKEDDWIYTTNSYLSWITLSFSKKKRRKTFNGTNRISWKSSHGKSKVVCNFYTHMLIRISHYNKIPCKHTLVYYTGIHVYHRLWYIPYTFPCMIINTSVQAPKYLPNVNTPSLILYIFSMAAWWWK